MENYFQQLVNGLQISSSLLSVNIGEITCILQKQNSELLSSFITESYSSILILEQWAWQIFTEDMQQWIDIAEYLQLFQTLAAFNKNLIFHCDSIEANMKASLLIPETDDCIVRILEHIEKLDDENHLFIRITSLWFDNLSYFLREHSEFETKTVINNGNHRIARKYIMTDQYKYYLTQLQQSPLLESIFTAKQLFYIKTCSLFLSSFLFANTQDFIYTAEDIARHLGVDYTQIMIQHTYTIDSWSPELFSCITCLCLLFTSCGWCGAKASKQTEGIFSTESEIYQYFDALIRIISHRTLHQCITAQRDNDRTILLDTSLFSLIYIAENQDLIWFLRSKNSLPQILLSIAETSPCEKISLCIYGILGEILSDETLKELKICDNVITFFFNMLEHAWYYGSKRFKKIPIYYLLKGFISFSKIDAIQQKAADANKIPLLIEMCDEYPMVFDILWALSFNQDIQEQLRSNSSFMTKLARFPKKCDDEQSLKVMHGILWNLESSHETRAITNERSNEKIFDIMISYSHKDESICREIYGELIRAGYRVWIDFEQMHGNVMDAMAQAIEQSRTVVICMSEQYHRSNYCRAEAHYAFQRQLHIVPILLQEHYKPDGWLLFRLGQLLYVNFGKYEFVRAMELLIKEIQALNSSRRSTMTVESKHRSNSAVQVSLTPSSVSLPPLQASKSILDWNEKHVQDWLIRHKLVEMSRLLCDFDGRSLVYLYEFIKYGEMQEIFSLLKQDSFRLTNGNFSLVELCRFQSLMHRQQNLVESVDSANQRNMENNKDNDNEDIFRRKRSL